MENRIGMVWKNLGPKNGVFAFSRPGPFDPKRNTVYCNNALGGKFFEIE